MELVEATEDHVESLLADLPQRSVTELADLFDSSPRDALTRAIASSTQAWTLAGKVGPVAMFGVAPVSVLEGSGVIWFMASGRICHERLAFAKATKRFLRVIFEHYATLQNIIDHRHADVVRWAQWLGAELAPVDANTSRITLRRGT